MNDLFSNSVEEKTRTLGFYQPFGSLMLHGKIETRWVKEGKKPPFPLGKYLFYTTKIPKDFFALYEWCTKDNILDINMALAYDKTIHNNGFALGIGYLVEVRHLKKVDEPKAFIKYYGIKDFYDDVKEGIVVKRQWALIFENVKPIEPFKYEYGKQGVGFMPEKYKELLKTLTNNG